MSLEEIISDHACNIFEQRLDDNELTIQDISKSIADNIISGASLTALMMITENIFNFGISSTSMFISKIVTDRYPHITIDTLACTQTSMYLLYMKHNNIIKLGHYVQVSSFVDMEVPANEYELYMNIMDYYDRNPKELECLSYLFKYFNA
jgi:hypothetical protein